MLISRDPFARSELRRERVYDPSQLPPGCAFCGCYRSTPSGREFLYQYRTENDSGRTHDISGLFCSVGCLRAYHND